MYPTQLPPAAAGQAVPGLVVCQRRPFPASSATTSGSSLASSGLSLLTPSEESNSGWRRGNRPEPQTEVSGGGGGRGPRKWLGYSGDGGHEEHGSGGLRLPWDRLFGCSPSSFQQRTLLHYIWVLSPITLLGKGFQTAVLSMPRLI